MSTPNGQLPVIPIRNTVLFPGVTTPLRVGRPKSAAAIQAAQKIHGNWILAVTEKDGGDGRDPSPDHLYRVGVLGRIERSRGTDKSGYQILLRATARFRIDSIETSPAGYLVGTGLQLDDVAGADDKTSEALLQSLKALADEILELLPADTSQLQELVEGIQDLSFLTHLSASNLELETEAKQKLLEITNVKERTLALLDLMTKLKDGLQVQGEIRDKLSNRLGKLQRETILREQLRTIREELGEEGEAKSDDYRKKIEDAGMPEEAKKVALEELKRLESIGNSSPESHVIRNYLDLMIAMPWSKSAESDLDLEKARGVLESDHYGLEKVKKRIIQHLAVLKLKKNGRGSILLLVGPPGVGKTSLGQSIAKSLGRKFVRASLGGVRDDAEIRGHRRTYIGAMPGRIVQSLKRAGENNPVMMLDEIDKLARGYQGDPASALLEVLDPEQNANFMDHYLDVPFDLSKVFFIATANSLETIPGPLLDRMEVIDVSGYTTAEKLHIAKRHLLPKGLQEHGLGDKLTISDEALMRMITHYTREAGVRELARVIANVCRSSAEKVLSSDAQVRVEVSELEEILGPERFMHEVAERIAPPGVATGLAWTPQGGEILFIEASQMPGTGKLTLTGQLGDVMKESAQIALSLVRSRLSRSIPDFHYDKSDLHIHVPAGAIPKDGPSAGVTMLTTIASLLTGRRVSPKLAMTGEVTLRGAVMPVGGIKEKVMAAHRAGIERVILSKRNQKDLRDVPKEVREQMKFDFVETASEVLKIALGVSWVEESVPAAAASSPGAAPAVA